MLELVDHRHDQDRWATSLGVSREAIDLHLASEIVDLHLETFLWKRLAGYDPLKRHGPGLLGARFYGQTDLPRLLEAHITGAIWSIATNPLRPRGQRPGVLRENRAHLERLLSSVPEHVALCRTARDFRAARAAGKHAAFVGVQGGNALDAEGALEAAELEGLIKVTLVHLTSSRLGTTSAPTRAWSTRGLTPLGHHFVEVLNHHRVFVDLAHIHRNAFFDAVKAHDPTQPLMVSHTGVSGVHRHWRNVDDEQLRAVAKTGGVVGIIFQSGFLGGPFLGGPLDQVVDHLAHVIDVAGEEAAALGTDWDGFIVTPRDMPTCLELPRLTQRMLDRGWSPERIQRVLGGNFLRALEALRP